ncbi:MAG TPA: alpha/beta hydrolase [Gemmatimonadaceae bacterium]|nr:alpha/beta hydrolase [Gemmatimonadaceae bacterium]
MSRREVVSPGAPPVAINPAAPHVQTQQFELTHAHDGRELVIRGDVYLSPGATTGVVFSHGFKGFGRWGFYPYLAPSVAAAGLNAVTFDYSGSGIGADRETYADPEAFAHNTYTRELADLAFVTAEARDRGWIGARYGVFGHSRGGGDAILHAARSPDVAALVTWAAISHVLRWLPAQADEWRSRGFTEVVNARTGDVLRLNVGLLEECERLGDTDLNIERAAARITIPWLLVHGTADESVPVTDAYRLYAAAGDGSAPHIQLAILDGANHVFGGAHPLGDPPEVLRRLVSRTADFFATHLR